MKNRVVFALVLVTALSSASLAQGASKPRTPAKNSETDTVVVAGRKVAIDRKTGKLRQPTPEESRALGAALKNLVNRSGEGLTVVERSNGTKSVDLKGRFQSATVVTRNADGSMSEKCVQNEAAAKAAIENRKATRSTAEVK